MQPAEAPSAYWSLPATAQAALSVQTSFSTEPVAWHSPVGGGGEG